MWFSTFNLKFYTTKHTPLLAHVSCFMHSFTVSGQCNHVEGDKRGEGSKRLNEQLSVLMLICCENSLFAVISSDNYLQLRPNRKHRGSISFSGAPDSRLWASVCVHLCMR